MPSASIRFELPALRRDVHGRGHVSLHAVFVLATPLFLNTSIQAVLSLTDTWFIGRISTDATAAMGATYFLVLVFMLLFGGVGLAVQALVAQAYGGRRGARAGRAAWAGLAGAALTAPFFVLLALAGPWLLAPFDLPAEIERLAVAYWAPRLIGGPFSVALWVIAGFFNGIGATRITLLAMVVTAVLNAVLNEVFMFRLGMGIAGSAWATTVSLGVGWVVLLVFFFGAQLHRDYGTRLIAWPPARRLRRLIAFALPMGLAGAVDLVAFALFQIMQSKLGPIDGAATQIAMMLTSIAYMPAIGFGIAGTTLVGQSIGAGDREWAARVGNAVVLLATGYMACVGFVIAALGPWLVPLFVAGSDPNAAAVIRLAGIILWIAACYQLFDGMNLGSSFCLRGAGDARVPAMLVLVLGWFGFVPLAHMLTFAPGAGWFDALPGAGLGAIGGWTAAVAYSIVLGSTLLLRWWSGAWKRIVLR